MFTILIVGGSSVIGNELTKKFSDGVKNMIDAKVTAINCCRIQKPKKL